MGTKLHYSLPRGSTYSVLENWQVLYPVLHIERTAITTDGSIYKKNDTI